MNFTLKSPQQTVETGLKPVSTKPEQSLKFQNKYKIDSTRLKNWDYSTEGAYFITICTEGRQHLFGAIIEGKLQETEAAKICNKCWLDLPNQMMPNHVHGIIFIQNSNVLSVETGFKPVSTMPTVKNLRYSLSEIIRGFKTFTARKINVYQKTPGQPFWQKGYYDRVIRNDRELYKTREYIQNNPLQWQEDSNNPENLYL